MAISRYEKIFGVGPIIGLYSFVILGLLWLLDRNLGHVKMTEHVQPLRFAGAFFLTLWICWHVWSLRTIRRWWREGQLCTSGPFRWVRHPMYAGGAVLGGLGTALFLNSWIILPLPLLLFAGYAFLVRREEAMMERFFGGEYRRYAAVTGMLFPRITFHRAKSGS